MTRVILPIILLVAAVGLFIGYTNPTYQATKALAAQESSYDNALTKAQQLRAIRDQLLSKRNTFNNDDVNKLEEVLPDNVDNIRLIIDINNMAVAHSLSLTDVQLGEVANSAQPAAAAAAVGQGGPVGTVNVGFSVAADYPGFLAFLQDLEHSVRIVDIEKLTFHTGQGSIDTYDFEVRTYWLH